MTNNTIHKAEFVPLITFEGCDCSGKTTQVKMLADALKSKGHSVHTTRETGGTPLAEQIRDIILQQHICNPLTELFLISAARRDHIDYISEILKKGKIVIADRFTDSSFVYQGYAKGLDFGIIRQINDLTIRNDIKPVITILLNTSLDQIKKRLHEKKSKQKKSKEVNIYDFEGDEFHQKVCSGFLHIAEQNPERFVVVDATPDAETVHGQVMQVVEERLIFDVTSLGHQVRGT